MLALQEPLSAVRPTLVLAHADPLYAALIRQIFVRLRWDVHVSASGAEARELAAELTPSMVILDTELKDESGWLTCAKLTQEQPDLHVVLVADHIGASSHQFAYFVGAAALVARNDGLRALVDEARDVALPAAG
jgi:DNA-binding NarL/FixJ family response regulator